MKERKRTRINNANLQFHVIWHDKHEGHCKRDDYRQSDNNWDNDAIVTFQDCACISRIPLSKP